MDKNTIYTAGVHHVLEYCTHCRMAIPAAYIGYLILKTHLL